MADKDHPVVWAPGLTRAYEVFNVLVRSALALYLCWILLPFPARMPVVGVGVAIVLVLAARGSRLTLRIDQEGVRVTNYWRSYAVPWTEVTQLAMSKRSIAMASQAALAIHRKHGRFIFALATPIAREGQAELMEDLRRFAPPNVTIRLPRS